METVAQLEHDIRNIINAPRRKYHLLKDKPKWNMMCSCLDTIGDTEMCFESFLAYKCNDINDYGTKYLFVYGILQAVFIQQDAVRYLFESLDINYTKDPKLEYIREIRNNSIGHPTKRTTKKVKSYNFIQRLGLSIHKFKLMTTYDSDSSHKFTEINIPQLINDQRDSLIILLSTLIITLNTQDMEHKMAFSSTKLSSFFLILCLIISKK